MQYAPLTMTVPRASAKLNSFRSLPKGWHYGQGDAIANDVLTNAEKVVRYLVMSGFSRTDAFPGVGGEVQVTGYNGGNFLSVDVNTDGSFDVRHEADGRECCYEDGVVWPDVKDAINKVAIEIWGTSALSTLGTGTPPAPDSLIWRSRSLATGDFRLLRSTARSLEVA